MTPRSRRARMTAITVLPAVLLLFLSSAWAPPQAATAHQPASDQGSARPAANSTDFPKAGLGSSPPIDATPAPVQDQWAELGPKPLLSGNASYSGRTTAIVVNSSNPLNVYIGAAQGGVWKSTDDGATWVPLTDTQASLAIGALALSPDQRTIYAGTGEPNHSGDSYYGTGLLKSSDGGKSWVTLGSSVFGRSAISGIVVSQSNPARIVVSTTFAVCCKNPASVEGSSGVGVFLSTDGGNTWVETLPSAVVDGIASLAADPSNSSVIYAGDFAGTLWRSNDGGVSWSAILSEPSPARQGRVAVGLTPALPGDVFVAFSTNAGDLDMLVRYSTDNGSIFYMTPPAPPPGHADSCGGQCNFDLVLAADPSSAKTIYFGAIDLYRSTNGGRSWTDLGGSSGATHVDQHAIAFSPTGSSTIFVANDGGVWKSTDQGSTWVYLNSDLGTVQLESIAVGAGGAYLGATQDNGCIQYSGGTSWNQLLGGDGGWIGYEPSIPSILYCTHDRISFYKSTDGGKTWQSAQFGLDQTDGSAAYVPVAQDLKRGGTIYLGTVRVYKSTDYAQSWSDISGNLGGGPISALATSPSNGNILWLGDESGNIKISNQSGTVWTTIAQKSGIVTGIAVDASNPYQAYAAVSQVGVVKLTRTSASPTSWQVLTLASPKYSPNTICIDPATKYIYVGTDSGVYYSSDGGNSWAVAGVGLPNAAVYSLITTPTGLLVAATHGRGVWSLPLLSSVTLTLSYSVSGGGSTYSPPSLTYVYAGQQRSIALSSTTTSYKVDYGSSWSITDPLSGSTNNERWITAQTTSGQATANASSNLVYHHQYRVTFNYTLAGGGTGFSPPLVHFTQLGASTSASAGSTVWVDGGTAYTYTSALKGSTTTERWATASSTGTVVGSVTILTNYFHQYYVGLSYSVAGGGTLTPPVFHAQAFGFPLVQSLTLNAIPHWLDANYDYSVTNPIQVGTRDRWSTTGFEGAITSPSPLVFVYVHQYSLTITGANLTQWYDVGTIAKVNIPGVYARVGGVGQRLSGYSLDNGASTAVQPTSSNVTVQVTMNSPHTLVLTSKLQYQVDLDLVARRALNSSTPPTILGDNYWYDAGTPVRMVLNGVWNRTSGTGDRLVAYSVNGSQFTATSTLQTVTVISLGHIASPQSVSARITQQYFFNTTSGSLVSLTVPPIANDSGWYDSGSTVRAVYNYVWNSVVNQSRVNAIAYSTGGDSHILARSGHGTFKVSLVASAPTEIDVVSIAQYRFSVSGGHSTAPSVPSQTGDGYYDAGTTLAVSANYAWNIRPNESREALISYTLDGVTQNITTADTGNFTTPVMRISASHLLTFTAARQFFVSFKFVDSSGSKEISPSVFQLRVGKGETTGASGAWLDGGARFVVTRVIWEGIDVSPGAQTAYAVTGPLNVTTRCRVYDLAIRVTDLLGVPASGAAASISLANGTVVHRQSRADGTIAIPLAPLGRFNATVFNLGLSASASGDASTGPISVVRVPLSYATLGLISGIATVAGAAYFLSRRLRRGGREKPSAPVEKEVEVSEDEL